MIKSITLTLTFFITISAFSFDHTYKTWREVLKKTVTTTSFASKINYQQLKKYPKKLNLFLKELQDVSFNQYDQFGHHQKLAFLINAYNAFTLKLIINHYPINSIKDIGSFFTNPWKQKFFHLLGKKSHLDKIEHKLIRKNFNEPRIHFALVCASVGCPALRPTPFTAENLGKQLESSAIIFLKDPSRNRYVTKIKRLEVSAIFKWYGSDFNKTYGSYKKYIAKRMSTNQKIQQQISTGQNVLFLKYDWNLNEIK